MKNNHYMEAKQAIFSYLGTKGKIPGENEDEKLAFNYLDAGLIDSFGIIEMVMGLESELGIQFTPSDMRSEEFRTIGGLASIASKLCVEKS